ncbi:hypothetical protein DMC30DRAFT_413608 [Rhodotorula diobovata]|uniref:Ras guanine nucleotide exchange factor domain-containing protein n=1 Tax=Rhodotorula diobovata TaxID=5288 RepID=A0A5C5G8A5_9BASI|nr:hypothetical protein DMC30DRAFT_413608 [Rhodotorula diobovata]
MSATRDPRQPTRARKRPALPASFLRASASPPPPSAGHDTAADERSTDALDDDGDDDFVETTSEAAARAVARFYAEQDARRGELTAGGGGGAGARYGVQARVDSRGRTVYRIRPIAPDPSPPPSDASSSTSADAHHPFARPSDHPHPTTASADADSARPTIALHRSSLLRPSRSIPLLRSPTAGLFSSCEDSAQGAAPAPGGLHPSAAATASASASPALRKAPSSPSLRSAPTAPPSPSPRAPAPRRPTPRARAPRPAAGTGSDGSGKGDVLGRILGWRADLPPAPLRPAAGTGMATGAGTRAEARARRRRGEGREKKAGVGLPGVWRRLGSGKGSAGASEAGTDRSDLPEDLVDELDAASVFSDADDAGDVDSTPASPDSSTVDHPFASPRQRPSYMRRPTGPFGTGVRIQRDSPTPAPRPAPETFLTAPDDAAAPTALLTHAMREVSSSDSIRTARADDPQPQPQPRPLVPPGSAPAAAPPARRFEDPSVFDLFHQPSLPCSPVDAQPQPQPHGIPFGAHGRLPSSASLASSRSARSDRSAAHDITVVTAPGDDPRFVIWGVKDAEGAPAGAGAAAAGGARAPGGEESRRPSFARGAGTAGRSSGGAAAGRELDGGGGSPAPSTASPGSTHRRRWSVGARSASNTSGTSSSPATSVRESVSSASGGHATPPQQQQQRVLMAATVERLVAELTSQIVPDLLAEFFLTFRHYLSPLSLLRLLIARFEWATPSPATALSAEDDALRRVVRVRTFVVLRYWLLNHFADDFTPSREVRTALTTWLNAAARDERLRSSPRDLRLVKGLKKTARRCKAAFILGPGPGPAGAAPAHAQGPSEDDLDLDFGASHLGARSALEETHPAASAAAAQPSGGFASLRSRSGLAALQPHHHHDHHAHPDEAALDSAAREHDHAAGDEGAHAGGGGAGLARNLSSALGTLGRLGRRLRVRASGAPGGAASGGAAGGGGGGGGGRDDLEAEMARRGGTDLLWVEGGVKEYLRYWGLEVSREEEEPNAVPEEEEEEEEEERAERTPEIGHGNDTPSTAECDVEVLTPRPDGMSVLLAEDARKGVDAVLLPDHGGVGLGILAGAGDDDAEAPPPPPSVIALDYAAPHRAATLDTLDLSPPALALAPAAPEPFTFSLTPGAFSSFAPSSTTPFVDRPQSVRIELDDLDDSDDDIDEDIIEAKRTLKRLPAAANLRLAATGGGGGGTATQQRRSASAESDASSYGFGAPVSVSPAAAFGWPHDPDESFVRESVSFIDDEDGSSSTEGVAVIPNFVLDGLVDSEDEDEPGDVEAALRRLEGLVDERRETEKKRRVERQMEKSGRLDEERKGALERLEQEAKALEGEYVDARRMTLAAPTTTTTTAEQVEESSLPPREAAVVEPASTVFIEPPPPAPLVASLPLSPPSPAPEHAATEQPTVRQPHLTVSPSSAQTSRKPSLSRIFSVPLRPLSARPVGGGVPSPLSAPAPPPTHRSFVLLCRTEVLAAQLTLIERDLLRMLSWQELVSGSWRARIGRGGGAGGGETDVRDWEAYVKERRRRDVEARERGEEPVRNAVQDVVARFNLTANWVCSEILLTADLNERAMLVAKFIRLAFKCYRLGNLQTLTQIVHGLQLDAVERLHKTWARVPAWEMRKLRGMQAFVSHLRNFKHLRRLMSAMVDEYGATADDGGSSSIGGGGKGDAATGATKGCIPFLGIFLRDLALNAALPTYLDPSSPSTPASVSPSGAPLSLCTRSTTSHPFPLASPPLAPLINVHKFRLLAQAVHGVVAFQGMAARGYAHLEPVRGAYWRCVRIRCLDARVAGELSRRVEP